MTEDDELAPIRKKKLEELMRRKQEILFRWQKSLRYRCPASRSWSNRQQHRRAMQSFVGAPPSIEALRQALKS